MADEAARREKQRSFAEARQAERGDYDSDRGDYDSDRGDYDSDRGDYDSDRGDYDSDRGVYAGGREPFAGARSAKQAVADIFRNASGLGGHLVIAFVAPIGASSPAPRRRSRRRASWSETETAAASAHVAELIEQIRQNRSQRSGRRPAQAPGSDGRAATQPPAYAPPTTQSATVAYKAAKD
jgi:hypothetical protein